MTVRRQRPEAELAAVEQHADGVGRAGSSVLEQVVARLGEGMGRQSRNPGVRIQWFDASATEVSMPAGRFAPARWYAEQEHLPQFFNDVAPRLSAAFDVSGDGRTAIKASASKSYQQHTGFWTKRYANSGQSTDTRNWFDCDMNAAGTACSGLSLPTNNDRIAQDNEIGPSNNSRFAGKLR